MNYSLLIASFLKTILLNENTAHYFLAFLRPQRGVQGVQNLFSYENTDTAFISDINSNLWNSIS